MLYFCGPQVWLRSLIFLQQKTWQWVWGWLALHPMYWHTLEVKNPSLVPPITAESQGTALPTLMADLDIKTQQHNPTKEPAPQCPNSHELGELSPTHLSPPWSEEKSLGFYCKKKWGKWRDSKGQHWAQPPMETQLKTLEEPLFTKSLKTDIPRLWALLNWMTIKPELLILFFCLESTKVMYSSPSKKRFTFY